MKDGADGGVSGVTSVAIAGRDRLVLRGQGERYAILRCRLKPTSLSEVISSHKSDNLREMVVHDNPKQTSAQSATPRMRTTGLAGSFR